MDRFTLLLLRHPKKIVAGFLLVTVLFAVQIPRLTVDPSMEVFVPRQHPEVRFFQEMKEAFGLLNFILVGVVDTREEGIYRPDTLDLVRQLCVALEDLPHITGVTGLYDFPYIEADEEGLSVVPLFTGEEEAGTAWLSLLKDRISRWPLLTGTLVSEDGKATGIVIRYDRDATPDTRREIYYAVMETIRRTPAPDQDVFVAGMTAIEVELSDYIVRDVTLLLPIVFTVAILCLWLAFRRWLGILLPMLTVIVSSLWTMGAVALCEIPLNTLTASIPVLLSAVGTAYTIHILFHFLHHAQSMPDRGEALVRALSQVGFAVVATGLTTVGGFASLGLSQVVPIRDFGIFSAVGTLVCLLVSITLVPAILALTMHRLRIAPGAGTRGQGLERLLRGHVRFVTGHRRAVYTVSLLLGVVFVAGTFRIYPESDYITLFKQSSQLRQSDRIINRYFHGSSFLDIIVLGGEPDALKDPETLRRMADLQRFVETLPHVGGTMSLSDYLMKMNQALHADDPAHARIPDSREMVAQCLLLHSLSGDASDLEAVVNDDYSLGRIQVALKSGSTRYAGELTEAIEAFNHRHLDLPIRMTASMVLGKLVDDLTIRGQIRSMLMSTVVVYALVSLILRSLTAGLLGILPLLLCILMNFGIMGWADVPLMLGTATIASVALGIGIDYAIHFLNMARVRVRAGDEPMGALEASAGTAGRAILYNAAAVGFGFLVLVFSVFKGNIYFGTFVTLTMFTASLATLTLLPCLICTFRPAFLRKLPPGSSGSHGGARHDPGSGTGCATTLPGGERPRSSGSPRVHLQTPHPARRGGHP